mmetsp:Transcript_122080/g.352848  ORF Transcript_122080/g.352848 Transcript_122080/m.352848 type:complete len:102 (+) Transcript_122080:52-357(+)
MFPTWWCCVPADGDCKEHEVVPYVLLASSEDGVKEAPVELALVGVERDAPVGEGVQPGSRACLSAEADCHTQEFHRVSISQEDVRRHCVSGAGLSSHDGRR